MLSSFVGLNQDDKPQFSFCNSLLLLFVASIQHGSLLLFLGLSWAHGVICNPIGQDHPLQFHLDNAMSLRF